MSISPINASAQGTALSGVQDAVQQAQATGSDIDFSALLKEALEQEYQEQAISLSGASADGLSGLGGLSSTAVGGTAGLENLILAAAQSGQADDAQLAVYMLLMMLQYETSDSSDIGPLMSLMAGMIGQLDGETQTQVYSTTMNSDYDRADLLEVEEKVFSGIPATQEVTRTGAQAVVPTACWKATTPAVTGDEHSRSPEALREIIDQFDVESAERYRPFRNGVTYCNIFVWDVTSALGCEIPHYIDNDTGEPRSYPDVKNSWEMNANATSDWLANQGERYGWREVSAEQAQAWANEGRPAVTAWKNTSGKPGHVQIVCPSKDGGFDSIRGVTVAQAGAKVTGYTNISSTFKQSDLKNVKYYIHD